jgi:thioredoxin 2
MPEHSTIIACPNCGTRNRVRPSPSGVPRCSVCQTLLPWIVEAGAATFDEELNSSVPVLVDFWAPWCGPCKAIEPALDELAETTDKVDFVKLDIDENPSIADRYGVLSLPTVILFADGEPRETVYGARPKKHFYKKFSPYF